MHIDARAFKGVKIAGLDECKSRIKRGLLPRLERDAPVSGDIPLGEEVDLPAQQCDMNFNVRITDGWRGNEQLVEILKSTSVPLRIYGPINNLSYQLQVDQLLRKRLQDEMKKRLNDWADKNQQSQTGKGLKQLLDKL